EHGLEHPRAAFEVKPSGSPLIMQCRHCLRYSLGYCERRGGRKPSWREPLSLELSDGRRFRLEFKCNECQMNIYAEK
ncbi:MAG: collagenase-like protease, partial [Prevotella sp.]